jgi:hypothetical protein
MEKKKALFVSFGIDFNFFVRIASISILWDEASISIDILIRQN